LAPCATKFERIVTTASQDHLDPTERRAEERQAVHIQATVREFSRPPGVVVVTNLSEHGCQLAGYSVIEGATIWLEFSTLTPLEAKVIWVRDHAVGCRFKLPLGPVRLILAEQSGVRI
jgi:hypothetical protein